MEENNEWMSIGDLMSGAVAAFAFIIIILILNQNNAIKGSDTQFELQLDTILQKYSQEIKEKNIKGVVIDTSLRKIKFMGSGFESGRANLNDEILISIQSIKNSLRNSLIKHPEEVIFIEGYTDTVLYKKQTTDNVMLSLERAKSAREAFTEGWNINLKERVACIGYGANKYDVTKSDSLNRRVEISFIRKVLK